MAKVDKGQARGHQLFAMKSVDEVRLVNGQVHAWPELSLPRCSIQGSGQSEKRCTAV